MIGRVATALFVAQLAALPASANSFQKGSDAYGQGNYQAALEEWWPLAASGHAHAQFNMGLMYEKGNGVSQDHAAAAEWYGKAAEQGLAAAQNNLGFLFSQGRGVPRDLAKAVEWYRKAARQGYATAQYSLGTFYLAGAGVPQDHVQAVHWYRKAADQGYAAAQYSLDTMYQGGFGVRKNHTVAAAWFRKAARQGHQEARRSLSGMTQNVATAVRPPQPLYALKFEKPAVVSKPKEKGYRVQLAAVEEAAVGSADETAQGLMRAHAPVLGNLQVMPTRADLGEKGIYYRFRAGPFAGRAEADALCEKLKARQQACIVVKMK